MKAEDVQAHFRAQVPDYAEFMQRIVPFFNEQREIMLSIVPFAKQDTFRVLDLGCGPGLLAERLLSRYPNARLTAFDLTSEMLDACRSRLAGFDKVTYTHGDFTVDSLGEDYDLIVASLSLQHLEIDQRPRFLRKACGSLNDGGVFIASEVIVDESLGSATRRIGRSTHRLSFPVAHRGCPTGLSDAHHSASFDTPGMGDWWTRLSTEQLRRYPTAPETEQPALGCLLA